MSANIIEETKNFTFFITVASTFLFFAAYEFGLLF